MKGFVLVDAVADDVAPVGAWLRTLPEVRAVHRVDYGHFSWLAEVEARDHAAVQALLTSRLRFHKGVEQVREVDEAELSAILASEDRRAPA